MAQSFVSAQCDLVASYMDGVHVKIAEAYKPPKKIGLPAAYNNRLPDFSKLMYDFSLEKSVLDKMIEWRKARQANSTTRQARLEEKRRKEREDISPSPPPLQSECMKQLPINSVPAPETTILTPQPLSPPANDVQDHVKTNGLDYADFDNDTSSPFDNMELKTINDMEELAQVLQPKSQWLPTTRLDNIINELTIDNESEINNEEKVDDIKNRVDDQIEADVHHVENHRSISVIMQELQKELERPIMEQDWKTWPNIKSSGSKADETLKHDDSVLKSQTKLSSLLSDLTEEGQQLARHLSDMGFPLSRAARAVRDLEGQDNKKVVEYLLAVQSLEEIGISGDDAEKALTLTEYDQNKAKIYYENLCTLKDLGFPEDEASVALLRCNIDRDRALDFLIP